MYIQYQASKLGIHKRNLVLYALCILYILSTATVVLDIIGCMVTFEVSKHCIYHNHFSIHLIRVDPH
jgi:hypothetical protein